MFMFQQRTIESYCGFCRALSWVSEVFSRVRREAWSVGGRQVFGRRPKTRAAKQREKTRITILRLDRNRKPRMRSLWQLQYYYKNPRQHKLAVKQMPPFHILSYSHPLSHPFIFDNNMVNTTPTQLCLRCLNNSNPILNPISFSRQGTRFEFTPKPREDLVYICFQYYSRLIEIELFIKMLYGVWSSLQPDHETNESPRRMQVSPPARNDDRSPI